MRKTHQTIKKVTNSIERDYHFNTAIAALMELINEMAAFSPSGGEDLRTLRFTMKQVILLLSPFAPHIAEELWQRLSRPYSIHRQSWPDFDAELAREDEIILVVQINGVRDRITVSAGISEAEARRMALESEAVRKVLAGQEPRQVIIVPGKLVNIVI